MALSPNDVLNSSLHTNRKYVDKACQYIDEELKKGNLCVGISYSTLIKEELKRIYKKKGWIVKLGDHTISFAFPEKVK